MVRGRSAAGGLCGLALFGLLAAGCGSGGGAGADGGLDAGDGNTWDGVDMADGGNGDTTGDGDDQMPTTPVLDQTHEGWQQTDCTACHQLPVDGHGTAAIADCAACHGGNGACDPAAALRSHRRSEDCIGCHGAEHGFSEVHACTGCHYAARGLVPCQ